MSVLPSRGRGVTDCGDGVFTVDTMLDREGQTSLHVIADRGRGIVVDTGTRHSVPLILQCLEEQGVAPADVDWIVVTHVHLDHAGGTGLLARELPNARILVHPRGARHLVDPTRLWAATLAVYGVPKAQRLYGELLPLASSRLVICTDGQHIDWQGRSLRVLDTPGHASHHLSLFDEGSRIAFTGDTFGVSYPEFDDAQGSLALVTCSPSQFDPDALHRSVDRIAALDPAAVCLTHYGRSTGIARMAADLHHQIDEHVRLARALSSHPAGAERQAHLLAGVTELVHAELARQGSTLPRDRAQALVGGDIDLNAAGLEAWLAQLS